MTERLKSTQGAEGDAVWSAHSTCPFCNGACAHGRGPGECGTPVPPTPVPWAYEHSRIGVRLRDSLPGDVISLPWSERSRTISGLSPLQSGETATQRSRSVCAHVCTRMLTRLRVHMEERQRREGGLSSGHVGPRLCATESHIGGALPLCGYKSQQLPN